MIVLAGGIGSGKSVVARILRLLGYGVFDCDSVARGQMESDASLICDIKDIAGDRAYEISGQLDRRYLASLIFSDESIRRRINGCVHRAVRLKMEEWLREAPCNIFVETAVAAESGIAAMASEVWLVEASREVRLERVKRRDGRSVEDIIRIIQTQEKENELLESSGVKTVRIANNPSDNVLETVNKLISYLTTT